MNAHFRRVRPHAKWLLTTENHFSLCIQACRKIACTQKACITEKPLRVRPIQKIIFCHQNRLPIRVTLCTLHYLWIVKFNYSFNTSPVLSRGVYKIQPEMVAFCCGSFIDSLFVGRDNILVGRGSILVVKRKIGHASHIAWYFHFVRTKVGNASYLFQNFPYPKTKFSLVREGDSLRDKKVALTGSGFGWKWGFRFFGFNRALITWRLRAIGEAG